MKVTKKQSGYINPPPISLRPDEGKGIRCGTCVFFHENMCGIVKSKIHEHGCCNLWSNEGYPKMNYACGTDIEDLLKK